jgi:hypothetical protein
MTTEEIAQWMRDRGVSQAVIEDEADYLSGERTPSSHSDASKYKNLDDTEVLAILEKSLPHLMKRTLSGGVRSKGGYDTDIDDTGTEWVPGESFQPGDPGHPAQPFRKADEGQELIPYEAPEYLTNFSEIADIRELATEYYKRFLARTPSESELDQVTAGGYGHPDWRERLADRIIRSPEYVQGIGGRSGASQIRALYKKYYGDDYEPTDEEIQSGVTHRFGPAGVEELLQRSRGAEAWRLANPEQPFRAKDPGQEAIDFKPATAGTPAGPGSWSKGIPTMKNIVKDPAVDDPAFPSSIDDSPRARAQPVSAPRKIPYSARGSSPSYTASAPTTGYVPPPSSAGTPASSTALSSPTGTTTTTGAAPFIGTMGGAMPPPPVTQVNDQSWNAYNNPYLRGGVDYGAGAGGFNAAPWSNVGNQLAKLPTPGGAESSTALDPDSTSDEIKRAYDFGVEEGRINQENAELGALNRDDQMARWIQSWNDWNRRGSGPMDPRQRSGGF